MEFTYQSTMQLLSFDAENGSMRLEGKQSFLDYGMDLYLSLIHI